MMKRFQQNTLKQMKYLQNIIKKMAMRLCIKEIVLSERVSKSGFTVRVGNFSCMICTEMGRGINDKKIHA